MSGESLYQVPPLSVPDLKQTDASEPVGSYEGMRLFVTRTRDRQPDFALTTENERAVAEICVRLDGIPLAIELTAARVGSLEPAVIAARLDDRFTLLARGTRTALPHQRTLRGALDWSWDLLNETERILPRRLSVFAGGWTLDAAEAVCAGQGVVDRHVADLLDGLVGKSLVQVERAPTGANTRATRYRLLETVRQYGWERLTASVDLPTVQRIHAVHYLTLAEVAETKGHLSEGWEWTRQALNHPHIVASEVRARALGGAGILLWRIGNPDQARILLEQGLQAQRQLGNRPGVAQALSYLGNVALTQARYDQDQAYFEESLELRRELNDRPGLATLFNNLGVMAEGRGDYEEARTALEQSLQLRRELQDQIGSSHTLINLGEVARFQGDYSQARTLYEQGLRSARALGYQWGIGSLLNNLGVLALLQGDYEQGWIFHEEGLHLLRQLGNPYSGVEVLGNVGQLLVALGRFRRAAMLLSTSDARRTITGAPRRRQEQVEHYRAVAEARVALGEADFAAAWADGQTMTLEEAFDLALIPPLPNLSPHQDQ